MKKIRYPLLFLTIISALPFGINVFGKGVYLHIATPGRTWVIAASQGVCHLASTTLDLSIHPMEDMMGGMPPIPDIGYHELIHMGPIMLHVENRLDPMSPFRFGLSPGDDYSSLEFPWLLIPGMLLGVFFISTRRARNAVKDFNPTRTPSQPKP